MAVTVTNRTYTTRNHAGGNGFLLANNGQIVTDEISFILDFDFLSSGAEQVLIIAENKLQILNGDWPSRGFIIGDDVIFTGTVADGMGGSYTFPGTSSNVDDINGNIITFAGGPFTAWSIGQIMPSPFSTQLLMNNISRTEPETLEILHNLILNTSTSGPNSLIDGEVNRFELLGVDAMAVTDVEDFLQLGNKSGGSYLSAQLERLADVGGKTAYKATFVYAMPLKFEDADFLEPSFFDSTKALKPYYKILAYPQENNPNSALTLISQNILGNTGWLNENYNQGINYLTIDSVTLEDTSGNPLTEVDYNQTTVVTAVISGPVDFLEAAEVEFYVIPDLTDVKNKPDRNCDLIYLSNTFIEAGPTITNNVFGVSGRQMAITDQVLDVSVANTLTLTFKLVPNTDFTTYANDLGEEQRRYRLTLNVESEGGDANDNNAVCLTLKQGLLTKAPAVGGPFDEVTFQAFYNHGQDTSGAPELIYNGCAEDDMLYKALFNLEENALWKSLALKIQVVKDLDGQYFDLFSRTINFAGYVTNIDGKIQINYLEALQQFLEAPDRNKIQVNLTGNDADGMYEVQILWSVLASWRYWIAENDALVDFFDSALPNNGLNNEWMRYLREAGFTLRLRCELTDSENTMFYFGSNINLQDYDDTEEVTTVHEYYDSSDVLQTSLLSGQIMRIKAIHTLTSGSWPTTNIWGWISCRPLEAEQNKRISTVWDWTSQNAPLKPLTGETAAKLTFPTPDVAVVECLIDTSVIPVNEETIISRIETPEAPPCVGPIDFLFDLVIGSANSEEDYLTLFRIALAKGVNVTNSNVCCSECVVTEIATSDEYYLWAIGAKSLMEDEIFEKYDDICCTDDYTGASGCEVLFNDAFDNLLDQVTGDTAYLLSLAPNQANGYDGTGMAKLVDRIIAITTDEVLRYEIAKIILEKGLQLKCSEETGKIIIQIEP